MGLTILFATDFSDTSDKALFYLTKFLESFNTKLYILYVQPVPATKSKGRDELLLKELKHAKDVSNRNLLRLAKALIAKHPSVKLNYIIEEGDLGTEIINTIRLVQPDYLVMALKSGNSYKKIFTEGMISDIIKKSACSLIALPEKPAAPAAMQYLFACNAEEEELDYIKRFAALAATPQAKLTILYVTRKHARTAEEKFKNFTAAVKRKVKHSRLFFEIIEAEEIQKGVEKYNDLDRIDLAGFPANNKVLSQKAQGKGAEKGSSLFSKVPLIAYYPEEKKTAKSVAKAVQEKKVAKPGKKAGSAKKASPAAKKKQKVR